MSPTVERPDAVVREDDAGRAAVDSTHVDDASGRVVQELIEIEGMGHAWSGGATGGSYTDPRGPSASAAIWDFFAAVSA